VSIVDEHTRECLGGMVDRSITGEHLISELDRLAAVRGVYPAVLRCDDGPELACGAMADWAVGESFNSRIRDECLNINSFTAGSGAQDGLTYFRTSMVTCA
jgi:hypothetical protein